MGLPFVDITFLECQSRLACSEDFQEETKKNDITLLVGSIAAVVALYLGQLWILCYNIHSYIVGQKRYKVFHLSFFYLLAFTIVVSRLVFFTVILHFLYDVKGATVPPPHYIDHLDNFATYFELSLGIQQLFSIVELHLMLQYSCLFRTNNAVDAQKKQQQIFKSLLRYRYSSVFAAAAVLVLCCILTLAIGAGLGDDDQTAESVFVAVSSTLFAIVSVLLLCSLARLFRTARQGFGEGEFSRELN